jgi:myo-inositol 2-dehydrogenase/D-chiro-inositol 1-dehydrogenase
LREKGITIRLGIVGCGDVTQSRHLPALRRVPGVKVTALADVDSLRLERVAARFGVARRYTDYRELIAAEDLDAVAVCVPPQHHALVAAAAIEADKHVFIEKPLALSLEECDHLRERAAAHDALKVMVGFNLRWHRLVREAVEIIRSGDLGDIKLVRTVFTSGVRQLSNYADWRKQSQTGGGALFELGVHHFDLLRFLFDREVEEVYAASDAFEETAVVTAQISGGVHVLSAFSEGTIENHELEIYGERGRLRVTCYRADGLERFDAGQYPGAIVTRLRGLVRTLRDVPRLIRQSRQGGDYVASYVEEWRHFINAITGDRAVACNLADGRHALAIALAAREAIATKRSVRPSLTTQTKVTDKTRSQGVKVVSGVSQS